MIHHQNLTDSQLYRLIKNGRITLAGNNRLKIYGKLKCNSGKRMAKKNRVFFRNEKEALSYGFRPCGHCQKKSYLRWKKIISLLEGLGSTQ